jgi:hypothetical protein
MVASICRMGLFVSDYSETLFGFDSRHLPNFPA